MVHGQGELERQNEEIGDHVRSLETLVERLNNADALLRVKEQQVGKQVVLMWCEQRV